MIWCIVSTILGAAVFCAGIMFEKMFHSAPKINYEECPDGDTDENLFRQWKNLFDYDGTMQEEMNDEQTE